MKLYEQYKDLSLFELMLLFHLHSKEANLLQKADNRASEKVSELAQSYLELLDLRIQEGEQVWAEFKSAENIIKETLEAFIKTREKLITKDGI